jgi:hypothetical protein
VIVCLTRSRRAYLKCLISALSLGLYGCSDHASVTDARGGANQPPLGTIERLIDGETERPSFKVTGWAGDDKGIRAVNVLVDGKLAAVASFVWERPDVTKVYPHFRHGTDRHGWETTVETGVPGLHSVRVEAVDTDGVTSDLGTRTVTVTAHALR